MAALLIGLLGGCGSSGPAPEDRYYRLDLPAPKVDADAPRLGGHLVVDRVDAFPVYRDRAMVYGRSDEPQTLMQHHYHFWIAPPPDLVRDQLVAYLRDSGLVDQVSMVPPRDDQTTTHIATRLTHFERVLLADGGVEAVVGIEVTVHRNGVIQLQRAYRERVFSDDSSFAASVKATRDALAGVFSALLDDLVASHRPVGRL
jgi:ABC-type uncharacterized transport system auxiliary subunit